MHSPNHRNFFLSSSIIGMGIKTANVFLLVVGTIFVTQSVGAEIFGRYTFFLSVALLLAVPAQLGMTTLLVREVACLHSQENWPLLRGIIAWTIVLGAAMSILAIVVFFGLSSLLFFSSEIVLGILPWTLCVVPILVINDLRSSVLRGLQHVIIGQLPEMIIRPGLWLVLVLFLAVFIKLSAIHLMQLYLVATLVSLIVGTIMLHIKTPTQLRLVQAEYDAKSWIRSMPYLTLLMSGQVINNNADIVMIGVFLSDKDVGIYKVVVQSSMLVTFFLYGINMIVGPFYARLHAENKMIELQKLVSLSSLTIFLGAVPFFLVYVLFGEWILGTLFGAEFKEGSRALSILCSGHFVSTIFGSVVLVLTMTGNESQAAVIMFCAAVLNVAVNYFAIPIWGIEGAAVASLISALFWNIMLFYITYRRTDINTSAFLYLLTWRR